MPEYPITCSACGDTGLVEAAAWKWQADRWKPCPHGCQPPPLKKRTQYECLNPECGKASFWTGDLGTGRRPGDHLCSACGVPYTELVLDGSRYKVEWETPSPSGEWGTHCRETESRKSAVDQYAQLAEWERTGEEPVRNVRMYRSHVEWALLEPDNSPGPVEPDRGRVAGRCPMGCGETLFLGHGGYVTCSWCECPNPGAAADLLLEHAEHRHIVMLHVDGFDIQHPLRERLNGELFDCGLHGFLRSLSGPPRVPGRYIVDGSDDRGWHFHAAPLRPAEPDNSPSPVEGGQP